MPTHKILADLDVGGEVQSTSLDINGNADISGALTLGTALAVAEGGTGATNLNALVQTTGAQNIAGSKLFTGIPIFQSATYWQVSGSDTALQRADARDDSTNYSRLHWYGNKDDGTTSNFRHAWYDGGGYIDITAASGTVTFGGAITSTGQITGTELEGTSLDINGTSNISGEATFGGNVTAGSNSLTAGSLDINGDSAIDGKVIITDDDAGALTVRRASNTDQALYLRGGAGSGEGRVAAQYSLDLVSGLGGSNSYDLKLVTNAGTALQIDASDSNKAIFSGAITSSGQITGTEIEGTSLDINGNADISGALDVHGAHIRAHGGDFILEDNNSDNIHFRANSNSTEGVIRLSNGSNWGLIARGVTNSPRIGAYHNGTLDIYGFGDSAGADHADDDLLAQFNFSGEFLQVNGALDINGNADISGALSMAPSISIPINITGTNSSYTAIAVKNTGTGNAGVYFDAINGDLSGGDYGFVGQNNSGYMEYHIGASSPQAYHDFDAQVKVAGELEATSLDINGNADISGNLTGCAYQGDVIASAYLDSDTAHLTGTQTFSGTKTFSSSANHHNGHIFFDAYSAAGEHYPHFLDGSNNGGATINWRQYYGSSQKTHTWASDASGNMLFTYQGGITAVGALTGTSLDINGNADISGNLSGVDTLTATTFVGALTGNASGSSGSCTGNAATATTATNVTATSVSNAADYFGCFVSSTGTQGIKVANGLKYNPSTNVLTAGKITSDTVSIVENAKSGSACMTITGAGAGTEANIALKIQGTSHGSPVKIKIKGEDAEGGEVGAGLLSFDPAADTFGIGQSTTHNSMAMSINNSDQVDFKNMATFTSGIDITGTTDATDATGDTGILRCEGGASIAKKLYVGSTITGSADVIAYSDERLKKNVKTLNGKKVLEMRGVSFERTDSGKQSSGVIAQELEKVAPELVIDDGSYKGVAYGNVVGYLIEAIKDQQKQIDELKAMCNGCSK